MPDYYCTWQTQLYASCDGKPEGQRAIIDEHSLFCEEKPFGWACFYPQAKQNLYLVMDDSWDVPLQDYKPYHGCQILNAEKFPSFANGENPTVAL